MTDFIEQMMKTAGVKKCENFRQYNYARVPEGKEELKKSQNNGIECIRIRNCPDKNNTCIYWTELFYPDFTAEKQLEIENLIINHKFPVYDFNQEKDVLQYAPFGYFMENNKIVICAGSGRSFVKVKADDRTHALAQLTTELIKAGELDKEKVREILER